MPLSVQQFVANLSQTGLMSAADVSTLCDRLPDGERPVDVEALAKLLVRQGKLTKYQAQVIYSGKHQNLVFGEYVVLDKLGAGGMGVVLKARHRRMDRLVAIKVLPAATMKNRDAIERFYREVKAAAKLNHPNIVTAHDAGEHAGMHFLVMEYVEGRDLAAIVAESGPLPIEQAIDYIVQAAKGLEFAHARGVVHRDIKPANLLLSSEGQIKILDMGFARLSETPGAAEATAAAQLTQAGQVMGTVDYMSPEQAMDTRTADHRADIYALGCTLYKLLSGQAVYDGDTMMKKLMAHQQAPIPSLRATRPDVPEALDDIFQQMVAKRPEDRYQSMSEVIAALQQVLAHCRGMTFVTPARPAAAGESLGATAGSSGSADLPRRVAHTGTAGQASDGTQPTSAGETPTLSLSDGTVDTDPQTQTTMAAAIAEAAKTSARRINRRFGPQTLVAGLGFLILAAAAAYVIRVQTDVGEVVIECEEPGVEVSIARNGSPVKGMTLEKAETTERIGAGDVVVTVKGSRANEFKVTQDSTTLLRNGRVVARIKMIGKEKVADASSSKPLAAGAKAGEEWSGNGLSMKFCWCPSGKFKMGEAPNQVDVELTRGFWMGKYEVTQGEYRAVMKANPSHFSATGFGKAAVAGMDTDKFPVEMVPWDQATEFCRKLTEQERSAGRLEAAWEYRLPTEAQWEYACRAGTQAAYTCGDESRLPDFAWYNANAENRTHEVGQKQPNPWGLHDMHGNVVEWCRDWYQEKLPGGNDPEVTERASGRVDRGGGWGSGAGLCRSANRGGDAPGDRSSGLGFRVAAVQITAPKTAGTDPSRAVRWPLAPSKPEDIAWLHGLNTIITLRSGPTAEQVVRANDPIPAGPATIVGIDFAGTNAFDDEGLKRLATLTDLEDLRLVFQGRYYPKFTPEGREALRALKNLRSLALGRIVTWASDERISFITSLSRLEILTLQECPSQLYILDVEQVPSLRELTLELPRDANRVWQGLEKLPALRQLHIPYFPTAFPPAEIPERAKKLPRCRVSYQTEKGGKATMIEPIAVPPPADAPFNAQQARAHQEAWAKYLDVKLEYENSLGMKFVLVPPGEFLMGVEPKEIDLGKLKFPDEAARQLFLKWASFATPRHSVRITRPFYLQTHEVTNGWYKEVMGKLPDGNDEKSPNLAVQSNVSLADAAQFCNALSKLEGKTAAYQTLDGKLKRVPGADGYRLPTEAQWEYACRAGTTTPWFFGDDPHGPMGDSAVLLDFQTAPRGAGAKANPFGLFDIYGGSTEWCFDRFVPYRSEAVVDPFTEPGGEVGVCRGGSSFAGAGKEFQTINSYSREPFPELPFAGKWFGLGRVVLPVEAVNLRTREALELLSANPANAAPLRAGTKAGDEWSGNGLSMKFCWCPPGKFKMGSPPDEPGRAEFESAPVDVELTQGFWLATFEVTQDEWQRVMRTNPSRFRGADLQSAKSLPVESVAWDDANKFCAALNKLERERGTLPTGWEYRLPSEAQWEYACRAGTKTPHHFDRAVARLDDYAWHAGNSQLKSHEVGHKRPNAWGLCDMHGNVWEWCSDYFHGQLLGGKDPHVTTASPSRVMRGGGLDSTDSLCRTAFRSGQEPNKPAAVLGLRVALVQTIAPAATGQLKVGAAAGQEWSANGLGMKFCWCPPGDFKMGEGAGAVDVKLTRGFWLGKYEVTQGEYRQLMKGNPSRFSSRGGKRDKDLVAGFDTDRFPVESVAWVDATEFCRMLTEQERRTGRLPESWEYRLPTEAQWEYGCRAGTQTAYSFSDAESQLVDFGWYVANSDKHAHEVGKKGANPWGLHDMHGNVWELCRDWYDAKLPGGTDPEVVKEASGRVVRGGGWGGDGRSCRSVYRFWFGPAARSDLNGFRVAAVQSRK